MTASIFWYDYETTGVDPRRDRPLQVAGIRTDEALNEVEAPLNLYCRPAEDILPHPAACLVTGITPATLATHGLPEAQFMARLHEQLVRPGTCVAGYNNLRFDDELTRHSLYRNFFDPYGREWQGGNSRWDLIDLLRAAYALRPEGLEWPTEEGALTLRLERLTAANGIAHGQAHDALADVRATIALARLIRARQPRLYAYLYGLRTKHRVGAQLRLLEPCVHVSGRYSAARHFLALVLPLAWHPSNRNALIVCDLHADPAPLLELDADELRRRLYLTREALQEQGASAVPLKLLHLNRCPVVAPLRVLRDQDRERLRLDVTACLARAEALKQGRAGWMAKLAQVYRPAAAEPCTDPEQQLYDGFLGARDRRLCDRLRAAEPATLADHGGFDDPRLAELLFRYRARNHPQTLSEAERIRWMAFCRARLSDPACGAPITLAQFDQALGELLGHTAPEQQALLRQWHDYVTDLRRRLALV